MLIGRFLDYFNFFRFLWPSRSDIGFCDLVQLRVLLFKPIHDILPIEGIRSLSAAKLPYL